ncbi:hypothetical protein GCK72_012777 [Caenorhabditis remanei]|uniref:F-box domain-containing protein n=1 Tax=Caenorhabditis remanei TaxID=31234 RepID=A0A6A5GNV9_CAERE|nr:hypothetical protein GCK72_012777 [Caenorhabditis remanei]KAF1756324.1 hypothetical protein GCK72_012777 [Caenorhabditis remanei]
MSRFPLLRLPTLPLLNCIQYLKVFEIIDFSLLSKRTKTLVSLVNWNQPDIHLNFNEDSQICLKFPNDPGLEWILDFENEFNDELNHTTRAIDGNQFPSYIASALHGPKAFHYLTFPNDDNFETMRKMAEHVSAIFRTPIASFEIHQQSDPSTMSIVKWFCTLQPSVVDFHIKIDDITAPTLLFILDNIKMTDNFSWELKMNTPDFEYTKAIDIPSVILSHSQWITLKSILNSSSRVLVLEESNLTFWDINSFLMHWLNGSNPQLEYIAIRRSMKGKAIEEDIEEAFQIITKDLEVREHEENEKRPMRISISLHRPSSYSPPNDWCYDIVRDDGTIGTFHQTYSSEHRIDFSLLSKRTKTLVSLVNWNQPDIHLYFIEDSQICLKFPNDPGLEWILDFENEFNDELNHTTRAIDGNQFPSYIASALHGPKAFHYLTFPNDDNFETMRKMAEHISKIFRTPIASFEIHQQSDPSTMSIVKWFCTLQPSVVDFHIKIDDITAPTLLFILDNIKMTDNFSLNLEVNTPDFEYNQAIDIPTLILSHSHWITLKFILNSCNRVLVLEESYLTLHDINTLLKCWLKGSNPQLEYISIRRSIKIMEENVEEVFQIITKDLDVRENVVDERRPMQIVLHKKATYQLSNSLCYDIVRDDGTIGTFHQTYYDRSDDSNSDGYIKLHYFYLHVWNNKI